MNTKRIFTSLVFVVGLVGLQRAEIAAAENAYRGPAVIRTYDYTGIPTHDLARAWDEVQAIFDEAGIAVEWKTCPVTSDGPAVSRPCSEMLQPNEFVLRLVASSSAPVNRRVSLGYTLIDLQSESGPLLMTVFRDLVGTLARDAGANHPSMLGRAIAHELGHLLLGNVMHSDGGLMRPFWSRSEIAHNSRPDWLIRPGQARQMRNRLASRHGT